jgi:hypothetical protein
MKNRGKRASQSPVVSFVRMNILFIRIWEKKKKKISTIVVRFVFPR